MTHVRAGVNLPRWAWGVLAGLLLALSPMLLFWGGAAAVLGILGFVLVARSPDTNSLPVRPLAPWRDGVVIHRTIVNIVLAVALIILLSGLEPLIESPHSWSSAIGTSIPWAFIGVIYYGWLAALISIPFQMVVSRIPKRWSVRARRMAAVVVGIVLAVGLLVVFDPTAMTPSSRTATLVLLGGWPVFYGLIVRLSGRPGR